MQVLSSECSLALVRACEGGAFVIKVVCADGATWGAGTVLASFPERDFPGEAAFAVRCLAAIADLPMGLRPCTLAGVNECALQISNLARRVESLIG